MRIIYRLLLLLITTTVSSSVVVGQSWDQLLSETKQLARERRFDSARVIANQALELALKQNGKADTSVAVIYHRIGATYQVESDFRNAERYYRLALGIWRIAPKARVNEVAKTLNNLGGTLKVQGRLLEAEKVLSEALEAKRSSLPPYNKSLASTLNELGDLYRRIGRFAEAEQLLREAIEIRDSVLPPNHHRTASSYNQLGLVYYETDDIEQAIRMIKAAIQMSLERGDTRTVPGFQTNLATVYLSSGNYIGAESLYVQAIEGIKRLEHPDREAEFFSKNNLGMVLLTQERFAEAEKQLREALTLCSRVFSESNPEYARTLQNIADALVGQGRFKEAQKYCERSMSIRKARLGPSHYELNYNYMGRALASQLQGHFLSAMSDYDSAFTICRWKVGSQLPFLSERRGFNFSGETRAAAERYLSCYFDYGAADSQATSRAIEIMEMTKGTVTDEAFDRQLVLSEQDNPQIRKIVDSLRLTNQHFQVFLNEDDNGQDKVLRSDQVLKFTDVIENLETRLADQSSKFRKMFHKPELSAGKIMSSLPDNSVLLDYFLFHYRERMNKKSPHYGIVVVDSDGNNAVIDLGSAQAIDSLIDLYRRHMMAVAKASHLPTRADDSTYKTIASALYDKILAPVENSLKNKALVFIAPDAGLNLLSFAALVDSQGEYLLEKHTIHYLSSGRYLIRLADSTKSGHGLFAIGDPDFDLDKSYPKGQPKIANATVPLSEQYGFQHFRSAPKRLADIHVAPLPHTGEEIESVTASWSNSAAEPALSLLGANATEQSFREKAPGKRVLHIATHGFFIQNSQSERFPLLSCGLLFAGANLRGSGRIGNSNNDGILTAYDVSELDLRGVDLAVLSACETGLGSVRQGEGVLGLRRAFQLAGTRTVISALWPVNDRQTAELMSQLFTRSDESIPQKMHRVLLAQLESLRKSELPDHPYSWAGFIALGDWR